MAIKVKCPACGKKMFPPESAAGKNIRCSDCRFVIKVPSEAGPISGILRSANPATAAIGSTAPAKPARRWLWVVLGLAALIGLIVVVAIVRQLR
ncbi:MAG: hypothetical protein ACJ8F7_11680 [Gemmataceae bacterium]